MMHTSHIYGQPKKMKPKSTLYKRQEHFWGVNNQYQEPFDTTVDKSFFYFVK
jgi:hypothetical protein